MVRGRTSDTLKRTTLSVLPKKIGNEEREKKKNGGSNSCAQSWWFPSFPPKKNDETNSNRPVQTSCFHHNYVATRL